jgi:4-diphosphocytidyl-2-C-methyl-D-erythritol kinase
MELGGGCSGSTIVGVGDSEPPQFIYDEEQYRDTFISGLHITSLFAFQSL